jgi:hypothetical protein
LEIEEHLMFQEWCAYTASRLLEVYHVGGQGLGMVGNIFPLLHFVEANLDGGSYDTSQAVHLDFAFCTFVNVLR